jgi:hypothetical protein
LRQPQATPSTLRSSPKKTPILFWGQKRRRDF